MPWFKSLAIAAVAGAVIAGIWVSTPSRQDLAEDGSLQGIAPVAAFAWTDANCGTQTQLREDAHLVVANRLLSDVAKLDEIRAAFGLAYACREAAVIAEPVADDPRALIAGLVKDPLPVALRQ